MFKIYCGGSGAPEVVLIALLEIFLRVSAHSIHVPRTRLLRKQTEELVKAGHFVVIAFSCFFFGGEGRGEGGSAILEKTKRVRPDEMGPTTDEHLLRFQPVNLPSRR